MEVLGENLSLVHFVHH